MSRRQVELVDAKLYELLADVRNNAVALVDAFDIPDFVLNSALGRYDGNVYEALFEYAKQSKLNQTEVRPKRSKLNQSDIRPKQSKLNQRGKTKMVKTESE